MTVDCCIRMDKTALPPLSLDSMTKTQLCDLIPQLIMLMTGKGQPQFGQDEFRPGWWPVDVPWTSPTALQQHPSTELGSTEMLRRIVRSCYSHSGNKELLSQHSAQSLQVSGNGTNSRRLKQKLIKDPVSLSPEVGEVFVCGFCRLQFNRRDAILQHQQSCQRRQVDVTIPARKELQDRSVPEIPVKYKVSNNNCHGTCTRSRSQKFNKFRRKMNSRVSSWSDHGINASYAWWAPKVKCETIPEIHPSQSIRQEDFLLACGLVTNSNATRLKHEAEESLVDLDCQIVAVEGPISMQTLVSPRTPKSLMSQLSRDNEAAARKRLNFLNSDGSDNESTSSSVVHTTAQGSLLGIPLTSPLGLRLKKHVKPDAVPIITDIESFCKTEIIRNEFLDKLRYRPSDYPVTYRKRRVASSGHSHTFKFKKSERTEFLKILKTGLNKRSRQLQRQMKKCYIQLIGLRDEEIKYWTLKRRTILNQEIQIDDDISIVQVDIPESSYQAICQHFPPQQFTNLLPTPPSSGCFTYQGFGSPGRLHSNHQNSASQPLPPQFLVKKVSKSFNGQKSQKLLFVPLDEISHGQQHVLPEAIPLNKPLSNSLQTVQNPEKLAGVSIRPVPKSRHKLMGPKCHRKQFSLLRKDLGIDSDEDITIESVSSSEEDEDMDKPKQEQTRARDKLSSSATITLSSYSVESVPNCGIGGVTQEVASYETVEASLPNCQHTTRPSVSEGLKEVPGQESWGTASQHFHGNAKPVLPSSQTKKTHPFLLHQLQGGNSLPVQRSIQGSLGNTLVDGKFKNGSVETETQASNKVLLEIQPSTSLDESHGISDVQLSIGAVYGAADLSNRELATSLGLENIEASRAQTADGIHLDGEQAQCNLQVNKYQRPCFSPSNSNFSVALPQPTSLAPSPQQPHPISLQQSKFLSFSPRQPHPVSMQQVKRVLMSPIQPHPVSMLKSKSVATVPRQPHPVTMQNRLQHTSVKCSTVRQVQNSSFHRLKEVREVQQLHRTQISSAPVLATTDWKVVLAGEDDVIEVICIDDDD